MILPHTLIFIAGIYNCLCLLLSKFCVADILHTCRRRTVFEIVEWRTLLASGRTSRTRRTVFFRSAGAAPPLRREKTLSAFERGRAREFERRKDSRARARAYLDRRASYSSTSQRMRRVLSRHRRARTERAQKEARPRAHSWHRLDGGLISPCGWHRDYRASSLSHSQTAERIVSGVAT